jgi:hypothetical protein
MEGFPFSLRLIDWLNEEINKYFSAKSRLFSGPIWELTGSPKEDDFLEKLGAQEMLGSLQNLVSSIFLKAFPSSFSKAFPLP